MKKILLGTTAIAALVSSAAFAGETPKVTLGGYVDFQAGFVNEDRSNGTSSTDANTRSGAFRTETELSFKIDGKTDSGLGYGGEIVLTPDAIQTESATDQTGRQYVYLQGAWGRFEGGTNTGAAAALKIDASRIARATGGIDGDYYYFMSPTTGAGIYTPDALLDHGTTGQFGDESTESISKVTYFTPRFSGFQAGVSFLFDTSATDRGRVLAGTARDSNDAGQAENVLVGGINYEGKFSDVSVGLSATGEYGSAENNNTEDLRTWNLGAKAGYMGFSVAASYSDWSDSLAAAASGLDERNFWTLGAAYETGPFGASVTYMNSEYQTGATATNDFDNLSVGVDYKMAPGFTPYAEVNFIEVDVAGGITNDNDATVFIAGTQLAF